MPLRNIDQTLTHIEQMMSTLTSSVENLAQPIRQTTLKRIPILFTLLVTFGVTSVFFGFERLLSEITFLNDNPILMLIVGIGVLIATGKLYKKL